MWQCKHLLANTLSISHQPAMAVVTLSSSCSATLVMHFVVPAAPTSACQPSSRGSRSHSRTDNSSLTSSSSYTLNCVPSAFSALPIVSSLNYATVTIFLRYATVIYWVKHFVAAPFSLIGNLKTRMNYKLGEHAHRICKRTG